jgi:hypothetical protein
LVGFFFFLSFCGTGIKARQALYHLNHTPFLLLFFR